MCSNMEKTIAYFAQMLSSNQPQIREKTLKKFGRWLERISASESIDEDSFMKVWKGIFYYFWHCDKMLVQQDRADRISKFIHTLKNNELLFLYVKTFFKSMAKEWDCIDRYRLDKFMMFVRKFLHQCFVFLQQKQWDEELLQRFLGDMKNNILKHPTFPFGLQNHFCEIYLEELAKVGSEELSEDSVEKFLIPFCETLCESEDTTFLDTVKKDVFLYLVNQDVDTREYHKFPTLAFNADSILKLLLKYCDTADIKRKNMKIIHSIVKEFQNYTNNVDPSDALFSQQPKQKSIRKRTIEKAAEQLLKDEEDFYREKKKMRKTKKQKDDTIIDL